MKLSQRSLLALLAFGGIGAIVYFWFGGIGSALRFVVVMFLLWLVTLLHQKKFLSSSTDFAFTPCLVLIAMWSDFPQKLLFNIVGLILCFVISYAMHRWGPFGAKAKSKNETML